MLDGSPTDYIIIMPPNNQANQSGRTAAQPPSPAKKMEISAEAKRHQHVQTEEEGPAARVRGGCIPCPVSALSRQNRHTVY